MRLINTSTLQLETFPNSKVAPQYAILSHTWGADFEEVSLQDMVSGIERLPKGATAGFAKIKKTCELAAARGLKYAWVDTCCIDKTSSAELSEAINSMFKWYRDSAVCYAFLSDWKRSDPTFDGCRWWTRGWTLQELVAPRVIEFYDEDWQKRGDKSTLLDEISKVSGIDADVLNRHISLSSVPVAVRMSWASKRTTTREEDEAYCLLGIFGISMPLLYGEGRKAFQRLQETIITNIMDMSVFAWTAAADFPQEHTGILAPSPREFAQSRFYPTQLHGWLESRMDISPSNYALAIEAPVVSFDRESGLVILPLLHYDLPPDCQVRDLDIRNRLVSYGISLLEFEPGFYVRANPRGLETCETFHHKKMTLKVLKTLSPSGSDSCGRRTLWLTGPLILPNPHFAVYIDVEMLRQPGRGILARRRDCFATILRFKTKRKELSSFDLICRFRNPRGSLLSPGYWECDLAIDASDATKGTREQAMFYYQSDHDFGLTSRDDVPSPVSKSLNIAFRPQGSPRDMAVVVTLQRKRDLRNGSTHFSLDVNLKGANK